MTVAIAIVGILATLMAASGAAYIGGRLQRSGNTEALALELQINAASRFLDVVGEATLAYSRLSLACPIQTTGLTSPLQSEPSRAGTPSSASGCKPRPLESSDQTNSLRLRATFWDGQW